MASGTIYGRICAVLTVAVAVPCFAQTSASPVAVAPERVPTTPQEIQAAPEQFRPSPPPPLGGLRVDDEVTSGFWDREHVLCPLVWGCEDEWKLQVGGSTMIRWEDRRNFDLNSKVDDDDRLKFIRHFVNVDVVYDSLYRAYFEVIDAHTSGHEVDPLQTDRWDIYQAFIDLKDCKDSPWTLRLGRQLLPLHPEGRLYGRPPVDYYWFNFLPAFDGAMLFYKTKDVEVQTFLLQPLIPRVLEDGIVRNGSLRHIDSRWFYGSIATFRDCAPHEYEFYAFGQSDNGDNRRFPPPVRSEDGIFGEGDRYTVGWRARGPIKKWDGCGVLGYGLEAAYQFGEQSNDDIKAHMLHADVNYEWEHPWKPKVTLLGNLASGDDRLNDGELNTFDPLYGSSHYGYGTIDFFRLSNMREIALTGQVSSPNKKWRFLAEAHRYWLDSPTDAWNTALGTSFGRVPIKPPGREAGTEYDFTAYYQPNKRLSFEAGVAHFQGGDWPRSRGMDDHATFLFFQTVFKF
jgi:hypothetical protein